MIESLKEQKSKVIIIFATMLVTIVGLVFVIQLSAKGTSNTVSAPNGKQTGATSENPGNDTPGSDDPDAVVVNGNKEGEKGAITTENLNPILDPEKLEAIDVFESVSQMFPKDSYMVAHVNNATVNDPGSWWKSLSTYVEEGDIKLADKIPSMSKVKSITYAAYKSQEPDVLGAHHPLSKQILLTSNTTDALTLYEEIRAGSTGEYFSSIYFDDVKDRGYIVFAIDQEGDSIDTLGRALVNATAQDGSEVKSDSETFVGSTSKELFTIDADSPRLFLDFEALAKALTPLGKEEKHMAFWDVILSNGLGLEKNSIWLGESKGDPMKWSGKFVSGGVNAKNINLKNVQEEKTLQYNFESSLYNTPEELTEAIKKAGPGGMIFDMGIAEAGLALAIDGGMSLSYNGTVEGSILDAYATDPYQIDAKNDGVLRVKISPRSTLQGLMFSTRDTMVKSVNFEYNTKTNASTLEFELYKDDDKNSTAIE